MHSVNRVTTEAGVTTCADVTSIPYQGAGHRAQKRPARVVAVSPAPGTR